MSSTPLFDFFREGFARSDLIALCALAVAGLSALYARRQSREARMSRLSAEREARRPQRLELFREMESFCRYCSTYYTAYLAGSVTGTRDLSQRISEFRLAMDRGAIYDMPEVAANSKLLESMGNQLQRHLARLGAQPTVMVRGTESKEDEQKVSDICERFALERQRLREVFAPYLHAPSEA
jgi:hypothetical protein